jgi:hypothetical protein
VGLQCLAEHGSSGLSILVSTPFALVVASSMPPKTLEAFIAYAHRNPGKLNFGPSGGDFGTPNRGAVSGQDRRRHRGHAIQGRRNRRHRHTGWAGRNDLRADLGAHGSHPRRQGAAAGRHRCGAQSAASGSADHDRKRLAGFTSYSWSGILAPAGTSPEIVDRLNAAINQGLTSTAMNSNLGRLGAEPNAGSPQDFAAFIADETTKWGAIITASGVKLD